MTVLIIDDDEVIGTLLSAWLLHDELSTYDIKPLFTTSCEAGLEIANKEPIDVVLMDIGLEGINGIEGTKLFKQRFPHMIISMISSDNNETMQEQALNAGAYDYISKPLILPIFLRRMSGYLKAITFRNNTQSSATRTELFNEPVYPYKLNFLIHTEEDLLVFWDTMFNRLNYNQEVQYLHDLVKQIYYMGIELLKVMENFTLFVEENECNLFVTIETIKKLDERHKIFFTDTHYEVIQNSKSNLTSIRLEKQIPTSQTASTQTEPQAETESQAKIAHKPDVMEDVLPTVETLPEYDSSQEECIEVFELFDEDEMEDFDNELYKISSLMQNLYDGFDATLMLHLHQSFKQITSILSRYPQLYTLYNCIVDFETLLGQEFNSDIAWDDVFTLLNGYIEDFITWYKAVFFDGASSLNFMDDSFRANIGVIQTMLTPQSADISTDDIFDF